MWARLLSLLPMLGDWIKSGAKLSTLILLIIFTLNTYTIYNMKTLSEIVNHLELSNEERLEKEYHSTLSGASSVLDDLKSGKLTLEALDGKPAGRKALKEGLEHEEIAEHLLVVYGQIAIDAIDWMFKGEGAPWM